jgi:hypothetical protein
MPNKAVTELIGSVPLVPGSPEIISEINKNIAPITAEPGIKIRWLEVLNVILAICGTIIPINPMGPQKAVTVPVKKPVLRNIKNLVRIRFRPDVRA